MEKMTDITKLGIDELVMMIGGLYIENTVLKRKLDLLMEEKQEKINEGKNK